MCILSVSVLSFSIIQFSHSFKLSLSLKSCLPDIGRKSCDHECNNSRDSHQDLLITPTLQLGLSIQALRPCLLDDGLPGAGLGLVEDGDEVEVDMLVEGGLDSGGDVV